MNTITSVAISLEAALRAVQIAVAEGAKVGVAACVTVVDPALAPVVSVRADGATPHSVETSLRKANTAASTRRPSGWMQSDFAIALPLGTGNLLTNIKGGFPIRVDSATVAGLGVAGGTPEQDVEIAIATLIEMDAEVPSSWRQITH